MNSPDRSPDDGSRSSTGSRTRDARRTKSTALDRAERSDKSWETDNNRRHSDDVPVPGWGTRASGMCVEHAIRRLITANAPDELDVWTLQDAAARVANDGSGSDRSAAWIRRTVAAYVGVYWWRFLPPRRHWTLLVGNEAQIALTDGRSRTTHTADLTWMADDGRVLVDEVKVATGLSYVSDTRTIRDQLQRHLQRAGDDYTTRFVGVRFIPLALPRRAQLLDDTGAHLLHTTRYCTEGGWT